MTTARPTEARARPSEARARPSEARGGPTEARARPSEARGEPFETRARPSEARARPSEARGGPFRCVAIAARHASTAARHASTAARHEGSAARRRAVGARRAAAAARQRGAPTRPAGGAAGASDGAARQVECYSATWGRVCGRSDLTRSVLRARFRYAGDGRRRDDALRVGSGLGRARPEGRWPVAASATLPPRCSDGRSTPGRGCVPKHRPGAGSPAPPHRQAPRQSLQQRREGAPRPHAALVERSPP